MNEDTTRAQQGRVSTHSRFTSKQQLFAGFQRFLYELPKSA